MPRPIPLKLILKVLKREGFVFVRQKGSHARFQKIYGPGKNVTLKTTEKEIPRGTFESILTQSGLKEEDFKVS